MSTDKPFRLVILDPKTDEERTVATFATRREAEAARPRFLRSTGAKSAHVVFDLPR